MSSSADVLSRANAEFIDELYARYLDDPETLDPGWRKLFASLDGWSGNGPAILAEPRAPDPQPGGGTSSVGVAAQAIGTVGLVDAYREFGHLLADINPLSDPPTTHPLLEISHFGLGEADLGRPCDAGGLLGAAPGTLGGLIAALRKTYCGTLGVEFTEITDPVQREWLQEQMEPERNTPRLSQAQRLKIYTKLVEAESFEQFLHVKFPGQKRFSLEGGETLIPMLETLVEECAAASVEQVVLGMAHRGRLNMLANVVRKPYEMIFAEFEGSSLPDWVQGDGDVKYHQGYSRDHLAANGRRVHVSLMPNPSHLEIVDPVVQGKVRAKQALLGDVTCDRVVPVLVHGDAAFTGQGVVPETLLLSHLPGYFTGGTVHIVVNNQIGFTTSPEAYRPTRYSTDIARVIESPVFHVNADDPEAAVHAIQLALGFRQKFKRDVVIDLVCFRRHGHNEVDEPSFTQPTMYQRIAAHPGAYALYRKRLLEDGELGREQLDQVKRDVLEVFDLALQYARDFRPRQQVFSYGDAWSGLGASSGDRGALTAVDARILTAIAERAAHVPEGFETHPKVAKQYQARLEMLQRGKGIDWGCAEMLAFGSLLLEGTPVRLSGQDSGRGTFSHRHAVLHDQRTDVTHVPLNAIAPQGGRQATFEVIDSMLSEEGVLGFEYGYSSAAPGTLTVWEAQFGDFANGAQVVIDTFIAAAESKWQRSSGLVLLLPHGYEGQGPEHSSARLERFLQLCADDNLQVVNLTTAAQYFHALRRQVRRSFRKPLVVMSPKSLLRFAPVASQLTDLSRGGFNPVLDDPVTLEVEAVATVALCSGKVFYDLAKARQDRSDLSLALVRVEELYPFAASGIQSALTRFPKAKDIVWVQEEPRNMGAWSYLEPRLRELLGRDRSLRYAGRDEAASPASGSYTQHEKEQAALLAAAFDRGNGAVSSVPPAPPATPAAGRKARSRVTSSPAERVGNG